MNDEFGRSLAKVLVLEGGYVNDPDDPGGATNKGVTQAVYDTYRRSLKLKPQDVRKISDAEVSAIYRNRYWDLVKGDRLPPGVGYVVFDGAVNSGPGQSVKWLQRALGLAKADGLAGPETLAAVNAVDDHDSLIAKIIALREKFLRALKGWKKFGKGWGRRIRQVLAVGQAWARGSVGPEVVYDADGARKARPSDAKPAPSSAVADAATGGGFVATGATETLRQLQDQLTPYAGASSFVQNIVVVLALASAALVIGGLAYGWWARRRRAELAEALS